MPRRWLIPAITTLIAIGPLYRTYAYYAYPEDAASGQFFAFTHTFASLDSLGAGALMALGIYSASDPERIYRLLGRVVLPLGLLGTVSLFILDAGLHSHPLFIVGLDTSVIAILCWLVAATGRGFSGWVGRVLEFKPFIYIGKISYGLYVYHNFMPLLLITIMPYFGLKYPGQGSRGFVLASIATLIVASISWHIIERPLNKLKDSIRFDPGPRGAAPFVEAEVSQSSLRVE
jgi:peptidoglycan/LPS O-acetylase OafA/YrhL